MKKQSLLFILFAAALLAGCTTPEQDQQIRLFWLTQYGELMAKHLGKNLPAPAALAHSMPEASPAPTVDYVQVGDTIENMAKDHIRILSKFLKE